MKFQFAEVLNLHIFLENYIFVRFPKGLLSLLKQVLLFPQKQSKCVFLIAKSVQDLFWICIYFSYCQLQTLDIFVSSSFLPLDDYVVARGSSSGEVFFSCCYETLTQKKFHHRHFLQLLSASSPLQSCEKHLVVVLVMLVLSSPLDFRGFWIKSIAFFPVCHPIFQAVI